MIKKFSALHKELSTSTKLFALFTILIMVFSMLFDAPRNGFFIPVLMATIIVSLVDLLTIVSAKYPAWWNIIKWTIMLALLSIIVMGFF